jgi:hypothetical protein
LFATRSQSPSTSVQLANSSSGDHSCRTPAPSLGLPRASHGRPNEAPESEETGHLTNRKLPAGYFAPGDRAGSPGPARRAYPTPASRSADRDVDPRIRETRQLLIRPTR